MNHTIHHHTITSRNLFIKFLFILCLFTLFPLQAADLPTLDQLLEQVKNHQKATNQETQRREMLFLQKKTQRKNLLNEAYAAHNQALKTSKKQQAEFNENERNLTQLSEKLQQRSGNLGELFGVARQTAGDVHALLQQSLVSVQFPHRLPALKELSSNKALPTATDLEHLWFEMQREMTEAGKVVQFQTTVITAQGNERIQPVTRIGVFNAISEGQYLNFLPRSGQLITLSRQPPARFSTLASTFETTPTGQIIPFALDPSRGALLSMIIDTPSWQEKFHQGGWIGYIILTIGLLAILLGIERGLFLGITGWRIRTQRHQPTNPQDNPLGRIFTVYQQSSHQDTESLGLKLDEAILKETPALEKRLPLISILATVAPLLGLLGTVIGMIETFQSIALFGTGDPKLMSSGISQALITTGLGLIVAIPILLMHNILQGHSNQLIQILDEQSAGLMATATEHDSSHNTTTET